MVEATAIDIKNLKINEQLILNGLSYRNNDVLVVYSYYLYRLRVKFNIILGVNIKDSAVDSVDKIYKNANWLERETSEMYGLNYKFKNDSRKLLLEYSSLENPLLKDYSLESTKSYFYNFFENQVSYRKNELIEL